MASFNQSPLGQTSLELGALSLALGTDAAAAPIRTNLVKHLYSSADTNRLGINTEPSIFPDWRREIRRTG